MCQPPLPAIDPALALRSLLAALPEERLREFVLEMLLANLTVATPPAPAKQRARGRPRGRPRGTRKAIPAKKPVAAGQDSSAAKLTRFEAQRVRDAQIKRERRARARAARLAEAATGSNTAITPAMVWQHATKLDPKAPWKALREFGMNDAVALDAYRVGKLPPGFGAADAARFLKLAAS